MNSQWIPEAWRRRLNDRRLRATFPRAHIGNHCRIEDSHLNGSNATLGDYVLLQRSRLENDVAIRNNCSIEDSQLEGPCVVGFSSYVQHVSLGKYSYIGDRSVITHARVGRFCSIGRECYAGMGTHPANFASTSPAFYSLAKQANATFAAQSQMEEFSQIYIGHDVWIGSRVFIRDGVAVGDGAIVGAGAVVVKDVPSYSIVGGVPAKVIRMRFDAETVARLDKIAWWNWPAERLRQAQPLIASSDTQSFLEWAEAQPNVAV